MTCKHPIGVACHCNRRQPCLTRYTLSTDSATLEYFGGFKNSYRLQAVDEGNGVDVFVSVEGHCQHDNAPLGASLTARGYTFLKRLTPACAKAFTLSIVLNVT